MSENTLDLVASRFRVLGEPYRLRILQMLRQRSMRVGELVDELDGNQPNVSKHLQILRQAGIVSRRRDGKHILYSLNNPETFTLSELENQSNRKK